MIPADRWTYVQVDSTRGRWSDFGDTPAFLRYFGLAMEDVDQDTWPDIISGRYWYRNPGGDLKGSWKRSEFGINVDANLILDVDGDPYPDVIGAALPKVYWLEPADSSASSWDSKMIGQIPPERHRNGQGFRIANINAAGKDEILLASEGGIYCFEIPEYPDTDTWKITLLAETASSEGFGVFDMDGDGDPDLVAGDLSETQKDELANGIKKKKGEPTILKWYENPGRISENWRWHLIGETFHAIDRVEVTDMDGNNIPDVIITEERFPGLEPDANLIWFKGSMAGMEFHWERIIIVRQFSMNNLDVGDIDRDGFPDIITGEHKGDALQTQIFRNDGMGQFTQILVDRGKESHLGTRLADMDLDGDLDIVSIAWDKPEFVHLWRNDGIIKDKRIEGK